MELDPELKIFEQFTMPDYRDIGAVRAWLATFSGPPSSGNREINGVAIRDQTIPGPAGAPDLTVRIYHPGVAGTLPVLVYYHSGSLVMGNLDTDERACLNYARDAGCVVVSVAYRLAPENPFPAPVEDCYAGLGWAVRQAGTYGGDAARVAVGGSSAGGTLAAAVALMARDRCLTKPALQLLIYPGLDDRLSTPSMNYPFRPAPLPKSIIGHMWRYYLGESGTAASPYAAPARAGDFSDLAPAYLEVGALDPLRDEVIDYVSRLLQAGVPCDLHVLAGAPHAFDMVAEAEVTKRAFDLRAAALRKAFGTACM